MPRILLLAWGKMSKAPQAKNEALPTDAGSVRLPAQGHLLSRVCLRRGVFSPSACAGVFSVRLPAPGRCPSACAAKKKEFWPPVFLRRGTFYDHLPGQRLLISRCLCGFSFCWEALLVLVLVQAVGGSGCMYVCMSLSIAPKDKDIGGGR